MPHTHTLRIIRRVFNMERPKIDWILVGRATLGMAIALIGSYASGVPMAAVAGGLTALYTGFASREGFYRTRLATMAATSVLMAACIAIGSITARSPVLSVLAIAACAYLSGIASSLGPIAALLGMWTTVSLVIFGHTPLTAGETTVCALASLCSGAVQIALLVVTWPIYRYPEERRALATLYRGLAQYARDGNGAYDLLRQSDQIRKVRSILEDPQPFGEDLHVTAVQTLLDEAERIRGTLARLPSNGDRLTEERRIAANALDEIATCVERSRASTGRSTLANLDEEHCDPSVRALFGELRAAQRTVSTPLSTITVRRSLALFRRFPNIVEAASILRQNLGLRTAVGRHAVRYAVVLALARTIEHLLPFSRGYWITLTAAIVLKPDFTTTFVRGIARIAGTLFGVVFATALVVAFPNTPYVHMALTIVFAAVAIAFFQLNFPIFDVAITCYVVSILALVGQPEKAAIVNRLFATVIGGGLAMLSYCVWPTWEAATTRRQIVVFLEKLFANMRGLFEGLADPSRRDAAALSESRNDIWSARTAANASLERMRSEPQATHDISEELALGIMAALHRMEFANL
ncbi:MAG: FUSC family protein, partial [Candidatus Eremiobacteraeota bacterium]|nr:FUSC family protein [Candidatus Eremiobacteraeota bacterium]